MIINSCTRNNNGPYGNQNPIYSHIFLNNQNNLDVATKILLTWMRGYVHPVSDCGIGNADLIMTMMTELTGFQTRIVLSTDDRTKCYTCEDSDEDNEDEV